MQTSPRIVWTSWKTTTGIAAFRTASCDCQFENTSLPGVLQQVSLNICILKRITELCNCHHGIQPFFVKPVKSVYFFKENMSSWRCSFLLCLGHSSHLCPSSSSWKQAGDYNTSVLTWTWEASATCVMNLILRHQSTCMLRLVAFASNIIDVHCTAFTSHCKLYSNIEKVRVISDMFSFQNTNALHPSLSISPSPLSLVETSTYPQTKQQSRPSCLIKVFNHCMVYIIINAYKWHIHHQSVCFLKFCLVG